MSISKFTVWQKEASSATYLSLSELELLLNFHYLSHLAFAKGENLLEKGIQKHARKEVLDAHIANGVRYKNEIKSGYLPSASVRWCSDQVGWGLFAEEGLEEGAFVGEYTGLVRKNDDHTSINNYLFRYPVPDPIGRDYTIDATSGNLIRFVNHSSAPNTKPIYAFIDGTYHVILVAIHPIPKGVQLTYDYGTSYWYVRSPPAHL
ncbi:MAG: SET domain-containing protein [Chlamydiales bacterium]|nr:SET domain-containing protein [Chlamydiales bacterium]